MTIRQPFVSIIVPVYNTEKYLAECLDSLVGQTLENIEIICVNDCSPDNSQDILNYYQTKHPQKFKIINHKINKRQGGARNTGVNAASGEYIGFVDSDDHINLNMYKELYEYASQYNLDIVSSLAPSQDSDSDEYSYHNPILLEHRKELIVNFGRLWTKIFKRKNWVSNSIKFPEHLFYEDNPMSGIIPIYYDSIGFVNKKYYNYRTGVGITSRTKTEFKENSHFFERLDTMEYLISEAKKRNYYEMYKDEIDFKIISSYFGSTLRFAASHTYNQKKIYEKMNLFKRDLSLKFSRNPYLSRITLLQKILLALFSIHPSLVYYFFDLPIMTYRKIRH